MRSLAVLIPLAFFPQIGMAETYFSEIPIGTYKTVTVTTSEQCLELCYGDPQTCRGSIAMQPDITKSTIHCYLNDGLKAGSPFESTPPEPLDLYIALADFNNYRARNGLTRVKLNERLNAASMTHANDMAKHGMISHTGTDGSSHSDRVQLKGYDFSLAAENVATGQESWEKVFKAWQDSPGHNVNLLLPEVTDFGVALIYEPKTQYKYYWAMLVATPFNNP